MTDLKWLWWSILHLALFVGFFILLTLAAVGGGKVESIMGGMILNAGSSSDIITLVNQYMIIYWAFKFAEWTMPVLILVSYLWGYLAMYPEVPTIIKGRIHKWTE